MIMEYSHKLPRLKILRTHRAGGIRGIGRDSSFSGDISGTGDGIVVIVIKFFWIRLGWGAGVSFLLVSDHLVSKGGDILIDLSCHGIFAGSLCESDPCAVLGEMGRLAGRTLQAATSDHDRNRAFLDQIVGSGTKQDTRKGKMSGKKKKEREMRRGCYPWSLPRPLEPTMTMVGSTWSTMSRSMCLAFLACQAWQIMVTLS